MLALAPTRYYLVSGNVIKNTNKIIDISLYILQRCLSVTFHFASYFIRNLLNTILRT